MTACCCVGGTLCCKCRQTMREYDERAFPPPGWIVFDEYTQWDDKWIDEIVDTWNPPGVEKNDPPAR